MVGAGVRALCGPVAEHMTVTFCPSKLATVNVFISGSKCSLHYTVASAKINVFFYVTKINAKAY